jgi:hypothetical protein
VTLTPDPSDSQTKTALNAPDRNREDVENIHYCVLPIPEIVLAVRLQAFFFIYPKSPLLPLSALIQEHLPNGTPTERSIPWKLGGTRYAPMTE